MNRPNRLLAYLLLISFVLICFTLPVSAQEKKTRTNAPLETSAVSAVLMDENGTVLFEKDAYKRLPPASVTKSMTLLLGIEAVEQGKIALTDEVNTSETAWRQGGSQIWLEPGERMRVEEMLKAIAIVSANDAAVALMEHIYGSEQAAIDAMNQRAAALGLMNTHFSNVNGLPAPEHYMSAYDAALIAKEAVKHPLYMELTGIKEYWLRGGKNWLVNTNKLLWWYPGADGLKTGWTEEAKYCFIGTAKRDGFRLISVVFATNEPRSHLRESMKLMDWGYANFSATHIVEKGEPIEKLAIHKATEQQLQLIAGQNLTVVLPKTQQKNIQKKIVITNNSPNAPIQAGEKLGELVVSKEGLELGKIDLVAEKSVDKAGFFRILQGMMTQLFSISR